MDHLDYIRIRGLEDSATEAFQGLGGSATTTTTTGSSGGGLETEAGETELTIDAFWTAQKAFIETVISYLSALEEGANTDAGNIVTDYIAMLTATNSFDASLDAFTLQTQALAELPVVWQTLDRTPSQELTAWVKTADTWGTSLEKWWQDGLGALYERDAALDAIADAQTQAAAAETEAEATAAQTALTTAQTALTTAQAAMTAAQAELPGDSASPMPGLVELLTLVRAFMTLDPVLVMVCLIRIAVPLGIDFLVRWIGGKLPGRKTPPTQQELVKIAEAVEDVALKDAILKFGDHVALHVKGQLLEY